MSIIHKTKYGMYRGLQCIAEVVRLVLSDFFCFYVVTFFSFYFMFSFVSHVFSFSVRVIVC